MCVQVKQTELVALGRGGGHRHKAFHQDKSDYRLCHFGPLVPHALMEKTGEKILVMLLTNSVQEFGLGGEVVIDDIIQQGDVYTTSSNISHQKHHGFPVHKFPNVDLPGSLIKGTVDVGTL